jgi:hypothetical protein
MCKSFFIVVSLPYTSWEFTEDAAFQALCDSYNESNVQSPLKFLSNEGAPEFQNLTNNAAGEGLDLSDSSTLEEFQQEVIDALEERRCSR